ncbi:MAG: hypothetical protein AB7P03_24450 [Kofleriaceae bacterium]
MIRSPALSSSNHRPAATIAIVTFVVLVLELTSTRLFAYIGSSHATSTALSTALLGLGIGAAIRVRFPGWLEGTRAGSGLAAALFALTVAAIAGVSLPGLVAISIVVFALAGMLVSGAYAARGTHAARATYALDLFAAATGCLVTPWLLGSLAPTEIMLMLGLLCCGLSAVLVDPPRRLRTLAAIALIAAAHLTVLAIGRAGRLPDGPLDALLRSDRDSEKAIVEAATSSRDVLDSQWSPLGRLDVHRAAHDLDRLGVFTDGMSPTYMVRAAHAQAGTFERTWGLLMSLPYRALHPDRVLVLGAGAGASVWLAKKYGASRVDAVEVNPAIHGVLARWRGFAGEVYAQPGVRLFIEDARRHLASTDERYDVIELALALTGNVHAQQPSGLEATLYTVEAVQLYLSRLTPTGALVLIHSDPGNAYRQLLTVIEALERSGMDRARALDGIVVLRDPRPATAYRYLVVVRTAPMALDEVDRFDVEPAELLWGPGDPAERSDQLLDPAQLGATGRDDLAPVHDLRPYFFQNTNGLAATALAEPGRLWVLAGAVGIVLVLILERRGDARWFRRPALVATSVGAGFLAVELALIQRFTLAAGGTLYAVSFVLFGVLAWSAAGALLLGDRWRRHDRGVSWACAVAGVAVAATAVVVRDLTWLDAISSEAVRLWMIAAMLAPVGLAIGCPFPVLLARHGNPASRIASLWAINGAASVAGGVVAVLALRVGGSTHALLLAAALYLVAAVIAPAAGRTAP